MTVLANNDLLKTLTLIMDTNVSLFFLSISIVSLMEDSGRQIDGNCPTNSSGVHVDNKDDVSSDDDAVTKRRHSPVYVNTWILPANYLFLHAGKAPPQHHTNTANFKGSRLFFVAIMSLIS
ncbi:hypothetical protein DPMN_068292 [Dreissena polymorpha]|uniref:Uncharacterized protein n=1 Tax=Dreissena polymorpha TaxID=45954 RepID=A0A9D3YWV9_DREPO|nr:hypothetical protein DPMN_068292 [Dreissena polymorpha]